LIDVLREASEGDRQQRRRRVLVRLEERIS
jgi:hypothetical protein